MNISVGALDLHFSGWLGRAMVLGSFQCRGVLQLWHMVGQELAVLAAGAGQVGYFFLYLGRVKRIWYLSPMRAAKVQASLRIRAVSPEPPLLAHTSSESRGTFSQKARSLAPLNGWTCAVKVCHDGMLEDTNSLDAAHLFQLVYPIFFF